MTTALKPALGLFGPTPWPLRKRCVATGPLPARIAFVGEAPGETEEEEGRPFVGASGTEFRAMCSQVGIDLRECLVTNVFGIRPVRNNLDEFCLTKAEQQALCPHPSVDDQLLGLRRPLNNGKYLHPDLWPELYRLRDELLVAQPTVVCALGATALWATTGSHKINAVRGTLLPGCGAAAGVKVLPTNHPAAMFRDWRLRPVIIMDLFKLAREAGHPEIRRPPRQLCIVETADELWTALHKHDCIAVDVETHRGQITTISFAPDARRSYIVAFVGVDGSSLHPMDLEVRLWHAIAELLAAPSRTVLFHNGAYDIQYLWRAHGVPVLCRVDDTMIAHHALYPEVRKRLAFLGSIYTDEPAWKALRLRAHTAADKGEDA